MRKLFVLMFATSLMFMGCGNKKNNVDTTTVDSQNSEEYETFDFEKYHKAILDYANGEIKFLKSTDDIRLISYALIDIDDDGNPEVWVKGDEGQDYQGVFAIDGDNVILLACGDARTDLRFYKNAVGFNGYYGEGYSNRGATIIRNSKPGNSYEIYVHFNIFSEYQDVIEDSYSVNGYVSDSLTCDVLIKQIGEAYTPEVKWYPIENLHEEDPQANEGK